MMDKVTNFQGGGNVGYVKGCKYGFATLDVVKSALCFLLAFTEWQVDKKT